MTLAEIPQREVKNGNGATTVFSFSFILNKAADVVVTKTDSSGVETVIVAGTGTSNYSLSVATFPGNGSITYPALLGTALAAGEKIAIERIVAIDQDTDLVNQGAWKPEQVEAAFDYSRMVDQQVDDNQKRSLTLPTSVDMTSISKTLPVPVALKTFRWDATGTALEQTDDPAISAVAAAASASAALLSENAASASETNAATSETNAATSETNAAASETTASAASATAVAAAAGIKRKDNCINATTANITLSGEQTIDGILTVTSRILVKDQTAPAENGVYVTASGAWSRSTDLDSWLEVPNATVAVEQGTVNADRNFQVTSDSGGTIGTTAMVWVAVGGGDLVSSNNLSDVSSAVTAFTNIKQVATTTATGVVELATNAETATGTDTVRAVTPAGAASHYSPNDRALNADTTTALTLALTDAGDVVTMDNVGANVLTVPANATVAFSTGTQVDVVQKGAGATSVTAAAGVTLNGVVAGSGALNARYSAVTLIKTAVNTWLLVGGHGGVV